jgi:hypothetical protein
MVTPHVLKSPAKLLLFAGLTALMGVLLFLACNRDAKEAEIVGPEKPTTEEVGRGPLSPASLTLPFQGTANSSAAALSIGQIGQGTSGRFIINQSGNGASAVRGETNGSGPGVSGLNFGKGNAGNFRIFSISNPVAALDVSTEGTGSAVNALATGGGRAGLFRIDNPNTFANALEGITNGRNAAVYGANGGTGIAGVFVNTPTSNTRPAVQATTNGTGPVLQADHYGSSGHLAVFRVNGNNRIRFTHDGKGIFNGGTQTGGADVAEAFAVEGQASAYEPGDVLVISSRSDRTVEKAGEPYSTRVIGVYATKPGVLLTEHGMDENLKGLVPVGVIGVIPTKVSAENGPIRPGDILATGSRPGHAMRASPVVIQGVTLYPTGAILGKAMEEFRGAGTGVIRVLVNVK